MWCERCALNVTREWVDEQQCPYWECPMENKPVNVGDDLHQTLGEALKAHRASLKSARDMDEQSATREDYG